MKTSLLAIAAAILFPSFAIGQEADELTILPPRTNALMELIDQMPDADEATVYNVAKMNEDYLEEAFVVFGNDCLTGDGCRWIAFSDFREDGWRAIGEGVSKEIFFSPLGDGNELVTDGVRWRYTGGESITLSQGALEGAVPKRGAESFLPLLAEKTEFTESDLIRPDHYQVDINGDGEPEDLLMIGGSYYSVGPWGTPYVILDASGDVILQSVTSDLPRIYGWGAGTIVVDQVPAGLSVHAIE